MTLSKFTAPTSFHLTVAIGILLIAITALLILDGSLEGKPRLAGNTICSPWPSLELLLPVAPTRKAVNEMRDLFLPSFTLFWPINQSNTSLLLVADEEFKTSPEVVEVTKMTADCLQIPNHLKRIAYNTMPFQWRGYDRQQWLMFWADNFTKEGKFVGFVDADTIFVSRVALPDIFDPETRRPIVRPLYGQPNNIPFWFPIPASTEQAIGRKSPFWCMTYFPVVIRVAHLPLMREHIRRQLNATTFDAAFDQIRTMVGYYSQFDIMCSYLWYFQRDDYVWAIGQRNPDWKGPAPKGMVSSMEEAGITQAHLDNHGPRVATHQRHTLKKELPTRVYKKGVCFGMLDDDVKRPADCNNTLNRTSILNDYEWTFEGDRLTLNNDSWALSVHRRRLAINDKCHHEWNLQPIFKELLLPLLVTGAHSTTLAYENNTRTSSNKRPFQ